MKKAILSVILLALVGGASAQTKHYELKKDLVPARFEPGKTDSVAFEQKRLRWDELQYEQAGNRWVKIQNNGFSGPPYGYISVSDIDYYTIPTPKNLGHTGRTPLPPVNLLLT